MLLINQITVKCLAVPTPSSCHLSPMSMSFFLSVWAYGNLGVKEEPGSEEVSLCSLNPVLLRVEHLLFNLMLKIYF